MFQTQFRIPEMLMDILNSESLSNDVLTAKYPVLGQPLSVRNYAIKFHLLLHLEEYFELVAVRSHDFVSVKWIGSLPGSEITSNFKYEFITELAQI